MIEIKNEKYYTPQEICKKFNVSISTVARWRKNGQLTAYKLSERKFMYSETEIEKFVKGEK